MENTHNSKYIYILFRYHEIMKPIQRIAILHPVFLWLRIVVPIEIGFLFGKLVQQTPLGLPNHERFPMAMFMANITFQRMGFCNVLSC